MAAGDKLQRTVQAYSIHGRRNGDLFSYEEVFRGIGGLARPERQISIRQLVVAVTILRDQGDVMTFRFVSGVEGERALFYDTATGVEAEEDIGTRVVADSSWVVIAPSKRLAVVERRRPGVALLSIEQWLAAAAERLDPGARFTFDLNPIASPSFTSELDELDRIRSASVVLRRPNFDWSENGAQLTGYSDESNATTASVSLSAGRGQSLSAKQGIVADIRELLRRPINALKDVVVIGQRADEPKERRVSFTRHAERRFVQIDPSGDDGEQIEAAAIALLEEVAERVEDETDPST